MGFIHCLANVQQLFLRGNFVLLILLLWYFFDLTLSIIIHLSGKKCVMSILLLSVSESFDN